MCKSWDNAHRMYDWTANLSRFGGAAYYPGYFNRVIEPNDVKAFEERFRAAIDGTGSFEIAGEVCFWKNYGNYRARNKITQKLLEHLSLLDNWNTFAATIRRTSINPSYDSFDALRKACSQRQGFATPITFLAFYKPTQYPMVDKHIANWWRVHKAAYGFGSSPLFSQRSDGWIQTYTSAQSRHNWNAYIAWKRFCCDHASRMTEHCGLNWRARDVEMAVWEAQKRSISLGVLQWT
jgi:hypothetical protein